MDVAPEPSLETGGYTVGRNRWLAINGSWPFGSLQIHEDRLVLHTIFRRFIIPRDAIVGLSQIRLFFFPSLRIEHTVPEYPRFVVFSSFHLSRVQQRLKTAGFSVDGHDV
jgi:hypothetical protein